MNTTTITKWQDRAKAATKGSRLGAMLHCALREEIPAPCFSGKASVTSDGYLMCGFTSSDGQYHPGAFAGDARDLSRNINELSKHLKLTTEEHVELLATFRAWIGLDYSNGAWLK